MRTALTTAEVNGRAGPAPDLAIAAVIRPNVEVMTLEAAENGWRCCLLVCWVKETYLQDA